jgi:uncharacterized membrane protein
VNIIGTGRENLSSAVGATVALDPVSVSFGSVPSGSGQTRSVNVTLTNLTSAAQTYTLSAVPAAGSGITWSVPSSVSVEAGSTTSFAVSMTAAQGASVGSKQATLEVFNGATAVGHAVLYTFVK